MCFSLFFFHVPVFADSAYTIVPNGTSYVSIGNTSSSWRNSNNSEVRSVLLYSVAPNDNSSILYVFSTINSNGNIYLKRGSNSNQYSTNISFVNNNEQYYYAEVLGSGYSFIRSLFNDYYNNFGNSCYQVNDPSNEILAFSYCFGEYSSDTPSWGYVAGTQYNTRINGSRDHIGQNIDRIVWLTDVDSKGNELPVDARVQIRAIPGMYTGSSKQDVLTKTYTDFILDNTNAVQLVDLVLDVGKYEIMWEEVANKLSIPFSSVQSVIQGSDYFYKMGWIYQIRLQVDDYFSEWQTVNTATSSGASESQTIVDSEEMTQDLIDVILTINMLNQSETTNWTINDYTISMDTYNEPSSGQKPWWAYLLEAILSVFDVDGDSQQVINNTNTLNIDFSDKLNEYNQIEDQQIQNLDDSLDQISIESDLINNNKFINSANWVTQQYNRITNNNPVGSLIGFSLLFGLALIFIGKIG